jgi:hypothetical protein
MRTISWFKNLEGRDQSEDLGVEGRVILEWILGEWCGKAWTRLMLKSRYKS